MSSTRSRPAIPTEVARQLRQEAGFGCVICGNPIIDYHHIIRWEFEQHFRPEDMVVFCPTHHREADRMLEEDERAYKANPFNISKGYTEGILRINQNDLVLRMANNWFVPQDKVLCVDNEPLLSVAKSDNGRLELSVNLYNESDELIAIIDKNVWIFGDIDVWDFEFKNNYFVIRKKTNDITLNINATKYPVEISGKFWRKKQQFIIKPNSIESKGVSEVGINNCILGYVNINLSTEMVELWPRN